MKKVLLFILTLFFFVNIYSQRKLVKNEYQKTESNTYVISYYDDGSKYIMNIYNPFEGVKTDLWQGNINKISDNGEKPDVILKEILEPFHKKEPRSFYVVLLYDMNGYVQSVQIDIEPGINVPITTIEKLERRLKQEVRLKLEYDSNKAKGVKFIGLTLGY